MNNSILLFGINQKNNRTAKTSQELSTYLSTPKKTWRREDFRERKKTWKRKWRKEQWKSRTEESRTLISEWL